MSTWRDRMRPVIAAVILRVGTADEKALRYALRRAWENGGGGPRAYWPYKVWLDEIKVQLGKKRPRDSRQTRARNERQELLDRGQLELPL